MIDEGRTLVPEEVERKVTYPEVARLSQGIDSVEFLDALASQGILKKERYITEVLCPACGFSSLRDKYTCTFCRGDNVETGDIVEHYACGNTDFEASFLKEGRLICPKCRRELKIIGTDYRRIGKVFKCSDCGKDSSIPRIVHTCRNCGAESTWENTRLRSLYKYSINEEKKREIESISGVYLPLVEFLQKAGFQVESPVTVKGESGLDHSFDILALHNDRRTLFDIVADSEAVGETSVVTFFTKTLDVAHDQAVLICIPKSSDRARGLSRAYGIGLVEGEGIAEILSSMASLSLKSGPPGPSARPIAPIQVAGTPPRVDTSKISDLRAVMAAMQKEAAELRAQTASPRGPITASAGQSYPGSTTDSVRVLHSRIFNALEQPIEEDAGRTRGTHATQAARPQSEAVIPRASLSGTGRRPTVPDDPRLKELETLYQQGKMGEEEYRRNKQRILRMIGAS